MPSHVFVNYRQYIQLSNITLPSESLSFVSTNTPSSQPCLGGNQVWSSLVKQNQFASTRTPSLGRVRWQSCSHRTSPLTTHEEKFNPRVKVSMKIPPNSKPIHSVSEALHLLKIMASPCLDEKDILHSIQMAFLSNYALKVYHFPNCSS